MLLILKIIASIMIGMGSAVIYNPGVLKTVINFWKKDGRVYIAAVVRLIFGTIFILAARFCRLPEFMYILGVLMIIGAATIFFMGPSKIHKIFAWLEGRPGFFIRFLGLVPIAIGALIFYSI